MFLSSDTPFSVGDYYKSTHHTINYISNARCSLELKKYTLFILYSDATIDRCHCPFALHCPSAPKERLPCPCCTHFYSIYVHSWIIYMVCSIYQKKIYVLVFKKWIDYFTKEAASFVADIGSAGRLSCLKEKRNNV
jgi:hypothetical protein